MMALLYLRALAFGRTAERVAGGAVFLKLSVLQLDLTVLNKTVNTESVFVGTVKYNHRIPKGRMDEEYIPTV